jgi:basic membrane protein A and related proteins
MTHSRIRFLALGASLLMLLSLLTACGGTTTAGGGSTTKQIKVGLVTDVGGLNDKSFNHLAFLGLQKAENELGIKGDVTESHSGDDYVPNLTHYATQGYDLVIGVGFLMQQAIGTVSGQFTNVHFAIIDGFGTDANFNDLHHANVESLIFKEQEAGALVGVVAGLLEKDHKTPKGTNVVSSVGGVKIPPVDHYIAGFQWGVKHEDPTATTQNGYSNDFADPTKCKAVADTQIAHGSEIVFQVAGGCGLGALQSAGQHNVWSIGVDADQKDADPSVVMSALKKVDVATFDAIKGVKDGTYKGGVLLFSLANDGVGYAVDNTIQLTSDEQTEVNNVIAQIKSGQVTVPDTVP